MALGGVGVSLGAADNIDPVSDIDAEQIKAKLDELICAFNTLNQRIESAFQLIGLSQTLDALEPATETDQ